MFLRSKTKFLLSASAVLAIALAVVLTPAEDSPDPMTPTPGVAAMRAAIDPETGALVTGPDALRLSAQTDGDKSAAMANMLSRSSAGLEEIRRPDGSVGVHLQGRFMSASVARLGEDGSVETLCTEDMTVAEEFLNASKPETDANGLEVR